MKQSIPIIDIFAGPGGLGEGFSSLKSAGNYRFSIKLSIEKDKSAHGTLELRSFFRQFRARKVPEAYYQYVRGELSRDQLFQLFPKEAQHAQREAWLAELGRTDRRVVKQRIADALGDASNWVLIGGPPCQAYSLVGRSRMIGANKQKYEKDERHFLYKEYLHILANHQPSVFVMENVKGLLSAKLQQQSTFDLILKDLRNPSDALGFNSHNSLNYKLFSVSHARPGNTDDILPEDFIVRSEEFGIPQSRHRVIILGVRSDIFGEKPSTLRKVQPKVPIEDVIGDLPPLRSGLSKEDDTEKNWRESIKAMANAEWFPLLDWKLRRAMSSAMRKLGQDLTRGNSFLSFIARPNAYQDWYFDPELRGVCNHETRAHIGSDLRRYFFASVFAQTFGKSPTLADFPKALLPKHLNVGEALAGSKFNDRFRVQVCGRPSTTIVSHISKDGHYYIHFDPAQCRSLTVREAARLQTFPDNYYFEGNRTQQYHQVGNAVPPLLAREIANVVLNILEST